MDVLVPVDGSDCSVRALDFAVEFAARYDGALHVVHFSDTKTDATEQILATAEERLADAGDVELVLTDRIDLRPGTAVGKEILRYVEAQNVDHVVMGHHGSDVVGRAILGSAAETVVRGLDVPTTIVP
ncbi:MAG: universal stress protein [Haloarculaceae archaeon]